jgi:hypothetical protein
MRKREPAMHEMTGIEIPHRRRAPAVFVAILAVAGAWAWARSSASAPLAPTAVLRVDTRRPGNEFAPGAVGLSIEARELSSRRLSVGHPGLVRLMRLLGPAVLRIGGNTVDFSWWTSSREPAPPWASNTVTPTDLAALRGLLRATGWRVLLGVDLGHFEPARAADEARYAKEILGSSLLGIEIGNEPNGYASKQVGLRTPSYGVNQYLPEAQAYRQALMTATPGVAIYGPASGGAQWLTQMGSSAHRFTVLTQHYYPIKACSITESHLSPRPTATELLSPVARELEDQMLQTLALAGSVTGRPTWMGETNSVGCSGSAYASPQFAGALWSLDWSLRAVSSGVQGLSFHSTLGACSSFSYSPVCAPDRESAQAGDVEARPAYYGLLAARQLEGGRFLPTRLIARSPLPNFTTWATLAPDGTVRIVIDNLATTGLAQPVSIPTVGYTVTEETLSGPSIEASSGIAFAGASVNAAGQWRRGSARLLRARHTARVIVHPASAVIVTLHRGHWRD